MLESLKSAIAIDVEEWREYQDENPTHVMLHPDDVSKLLVNGDIQYDYEDTANPLDLVYTCWIPSDTMVVDPVDLMVHESKQVTTGTCLVYSSPSRQDLVPADLPEDIVAKGKKKKKTKKKEKKTKVEPKYTDTPVVIIY